MEPGEVFCISMDLYDCSGEFLFLQRVNSVYMMMGMCALCMWILESCAGERNEGKGMKTALKGRGYSHSRYLGLAR